MPDTAAPPGERHLMSFKTLRRWLRRVWITGGLLFTLWLVWNAQAHGVSRSLSESSLSVTVARADGVTRFEPTSASPTHPGVVFLPGGGIDPRAYVPFVRAIAEAGYPSAVVDVPWRVAPTEGSRATLWRRIVGVTSAWGDDRPMVLSGHSRGAALAGRFAHRHPATLSGLALIATTHPRDEDLSTLTIPVVKILGSQDCVAPPAGARANSRNLPASANWVVIEGANHAQFGHYGSQINDCSAAIAREAQQAQALDAVLALLRAVEGTSEN